MGLMKYINLPLAENVDIREGSILLAVCLLEFIRVHLGNKGSLSENGVFDSLKIQISYSFFFNFSLQSLAQRNPDFTCDVRCCLHPSYTTPHFEARGDYMWTSAGFTVNRASFCCYIYLLNMQNANIRLKL